MKQRAVSSIFNVLIVLIFLFALPPVLSISAQVEEDPDFIVTLALMAVADDRLDGVMDASALSNLRAVVDEYYTQKGNLQMDADAASALNHQRQVVLTSLDKKIQNQKTLNYRAQVGLFVAMVDSTNDIYQKDPALNNDPYDVYHSALSSGYEPNPEAVAMLKQRLSDNTQLALKQNLDGEVAASVPGGKALINQSSETAYDYNAGLNGADSSITVHPRPLNFVNNGNKTVHVLVEYYQAPKGLSVAAPAMNVEVLGGNSIVMTGFPQGNYVFCVDWQTDLDTNGDGIKDYDRAVVRGWVSASHPKDPQQAQVIHVSASYSETPTGRCGGFVGEAPSTEEVMRETAMTEDNPENIAVAPTQQEPDDPEEHSPQSGGDRGYSGADFWDQGEGPGDDTSADHTLTSYEKANEGGHAYAVVCKDVGKRMEPTEYVFTTIQFTADGVHLSGGQGSAFYSRVMSNHYARSDGSRIIFSDLGFSSKIWLYTETTSEGVEKPVYRNCTARLND